MSGPLEVKAVSLMRGELAHLVERYYGIVEVTGSIPVFSTGNDAPAAL